MLRGWRPAFPETTGYIIGTLLEHAARTGDESLVTRAREMGDWEIEVQNPDGGVMTGRRQVPARPLGRLQHRHGHLRLARPPREARRRALPPGRSQGGRMARAGAGSGRDLAGRERLRRDPAHLLLAGRLGAPAPRRRIRRGALRATSPAATSTGLSPSSTRTAGSTGASSEKARFRAPTRSRTRCAGSSRARR